jgi:hypothetical protein
VSSVFSGDRRRLSHKDCRSPPTRKPRRRAEIDLDKAYSAVQACAVVVATPNSPKHEDQSKLGLDRPDLGSRWRFKSRPRSVAPDLRRSGRIASHLHPDPKRTMRMNAARKGLVLLNVV